MQRKEERILKTLMLLVVAGIVLLTVTSGTVAGAGSGCPTCDFEPTHPFLMGDDGTTCSSCGGPRSSDFSVLISGDIPIRPTNCDYEDPSLIAYIDDLKNISDPNVVIVDVRTPAQYAAGHIPGAINLDWAKFRNGKGVFIGLENATRILGEQGLNQENELIVYCSSATGTQCPASSYVFWMLEYLGHEHVSVLDGGLNAWWPLYGYTQNETTRPPTNYTAHVVDDRFADTEWVQNNLNNSGVQIVDARTTEDYKAGHIEGAININYENLFRDGDRLRGADGLRLFLSPVVIAGLDKSKDTVVYCESGASASFLYLPLRMMGYQVRNYEGSWNVWCETHPGLTIPISNVSVNPSSVYGGGTVKIYADVKIKSSEMVSMSSSTGSTGTSFVQGYIHDGKGASVKIVNMHDASDDGRYEGEWVTDSSEAGIYYVDIVASDGVLTTKKKNAAIFEVVLDTAGP
ncbi:3-mercaptopyruvate sulfurtransferase [Methanophagales archaeon]|nr:3-mercaptopyruvate sulfurtransferase [Methanophagales archaeon]